MIALASDALARGLLLFVVAVGLSLTIGLLRTVDLSQAARAMLGGQVTVWLVAALGWRFGPALAAAALLLAAFGVVLERIVMRRLYRRGHRDQALFTLGVALLLVAAMRFVGGAAPQSPATPAGAVDLGFGPLPPAWALAVGVGAAAALLLGAVRARTRFGIGLRAAIENRDAAGALGIDLRRIDRDVLAGGAALAAVGGGQIAAGAAIPDWAIGTGATGTTGAIVAGTAGAGMVPPGLALTLLPPIVLVVAVGGAGRIGGTLVAALLLAAAEAAGHRLAAGLGGPVAMLLAGAVLLAWRPHGLLLPRHAGLPAWIVPALAGAVAAAGIAALDRGGPSFTVVLLAAGLAAIALALTVGRFAKMPARGQAHGHAGVAAAADGLPATAGNPPVGAPASASAGASAGAPAGAPAGALLAVRGLAAGYRPTTVVAGVSFSLAAGSRTALIGRDGAGKSTVLKAIIGHADILGGEIVCDGADIAHWSAQQRARRGVGYVSQARDVFASLTVEENLRAGLAHGAPDELAVAYRLFPQLHAQSRLPGDRLTPEDRLALAIARALLARPRLLLLDQPLTGLAPPRRAELLATIDRASREAGLAILIAEPAAGDVTGFAERVLVLERGALVFSGRGRDLQEGTWNRS
ncbi:MAG: ATP-binding cassette domain-containing protein [Lautropia sp.]